MSDRQDLSACVFRRICGLRRARSTTLSHWWESGGKEAVELVFGGLLIAVAIALHFACCDWRLPRWEYSPWSHSHVRTHYDNELIGFVHAGSLFRTVVGPEGAMYDLEQAAWWGVYVPLLLIFVGALMLFVRLAPEAYTEPLRRRIAAVIPGRSRRLVGDTMIILVTLFMGSTLVAGTTYVAQVAKPTLVQPQNDAYCASIPVIFTVFVPAIPSVILLGFVGILFLGFAGAFGWRCYKYPRAFYVCPSGNRRSRAAGLRVAAPASPLAGEKRG